VFDGDGVLVTHQRKKATNLDRSYIERIDLGSGFYSVLAWTGIEDSHFDVSDLQDGITQKSDLLFLLKRVQDIASLTNDKKVYYGESAAIYVEAINSESEYINVPVNLLEITNRFTITIKGLKEKADDYDIYIESDNGSMNLDGSIAQDKIIKYTSTILYESEILRSEFTTLKLETDHNNTIVIRSKSNGKLLYSGNLLEALLLKNPNVNLNCDHDFTIDFTVEDQGGSDTYIMMKIWVNNWLVHSYETEM